MALKVLQLCNKAPFPANDGSSIAIYNMARGLLQNGVQLRLITINTKKNFKPDEGVPLKFKEATCYTSVYHNTNVSLMGAVGNLFSNASYFVSRFFFRRFTNALTDILKAEKYDIVLLEGLFMAVYLPVIRKHSGAKVVLRAHNIEHVIWTRHIAQERSAVKRWYLTIQNKRLKKFELQVFNSVDAIIPITKTDEKKIMELGCDKPLFTCITGIMPIEYADLGKTPQKKNTVFYFGSMDWLPNQEAVTWFLNNCWSEVQKAVPDARFVIAGRGMPLHFFHINLPGVVIMEEVEEPITFYHQHQVMVVPLWSGSGLRIKIVEGMACGKAIVSTSIGAEGINCQNGNDILIADDAADFIKKVVLLLTNEERRLQLSQQARLFAAKEFDNTLIVERLVDFFKKGLHV